MDDKKIQITMYATCLIDILGQQKALFGWSFENKQRIIQGFSEEESMMTHLRNTAGIISKIKKSFLELEEGFYSEPFLKNYPDGIPEGVLTRYASIKSMEYGNRISTQQFSDTLVFSAPVYLPEHQQASLLHLVAQVFACAFTMIRFWYEKTYFRGGITVDYGINDELCGGFYGPALAHAHFLESKEAQYPRVILSDRCFSAMNGIISHTDDPVKKRHYESIRHMVEHLTYRDDNDGYRCIDYLGEYMKSLLQRTTKTDIKNSVRQIFINACEEEKRFRAQFESSQTNSEREENEKLYGRYKKMREYIESRLPIWEL